MDSIIPDFERETLIELPKVFDCAAIRAKRCEKCDKVYFVNLGFEDRFICHSCRNINQGGV